MRKTLSFYFSRRHGFSNAEDLAQETLLVVWRRSDFLFDSADQFPRVVYGFANHISKHAYRQAHKDQGPEIDPRTASRQAQVGNLRGEEVAVYFQEFRRDSEAALSPGDWDLVRRLMESDTAEVYESFGLANSGKMRVRLHRIRRKLKGMAESSPPFDKPPAAKKRGRKIVPSQESKTGVTFHE